MYAPLRVLSVVMALLLTGTVLAGPAHAAKGRNNDNAKMCQKGGWQSLYTADGATFANTGGCVSYAAQGGELATEPPAPTAQSICEAAGGSFITDGDPKAMLWRCGGDFTSPAYHQLARDLEERCGLEGGRLGGGWLGDAYPDSLWCYSDA